MRYNLKILLVVFFLTANAFSQTIEELYSQRNFKKLIEYSNSETLTKEECYYIGYAFFQLEDDKNAIKMYDMAIKKGLDEDYIYLYKGLSLRYDKQYDKAIENFKIAIQRNPKGQKNYTELANLFYFQQKFDSALAYFYTARAQEFEHGDPYLKIPNIYHVQKNFEKALEEYYVSATLIDKNDPIYIDLLENIGLIELLVKKNYQNSIKAYAELLSIIPNEYDLYQFLIQSYYANEQFIQGDSVFNILKVQYEKKELPDEMMQVRGETVDKFIWNGQKVGVMKYYKKPQEFPESIYQFFLFDKTGEKVVQKILTEKTEGDPLGVKHMLCGINNETGSHFTYPIGWKTDEIDYKKLKEYVFMILNGEMKPGASSHFETESDEE